MNPSFVPGADPLGLPAPAQLLQLLLIATIAIHFAFLGAALGGAALMAVGGFLGRSNPASRPALIARTLAGALPVVISFAITSGVAPLLFVQVLYGSFFYTANVLLGFRWLALVALLLIGFYGAYYFASRSAPGASRPGLRSLTAAVVVLAFCAIGLILVVNHLLSVSPDVWRGVQGGTESLFSLPTLWPRYLHALVGTGVLGSLLLAHLSLRRASCGDDQALKIARLGLLIAGVFGTLQALAGLHYAFALPFPQRSSLLLLQHPAAVAWGVAAFLGVLGSLFAILGSNAHNPRPFAWVSTSLLSLTLLGMAWAREHLRMLSIENVVPQGAWRFRPQIAAQVLFVIVALLAVAALVWMINAYLRAAPQLGTRQLPPEWRGGTAPARARARARAQGRPRV